MNYCEIKTHDIANGDGVRVSLFVSGCRNRCKGCFNKETWDFNYGNCYGSNTEDYILRCLDKPYIAGFSVLGGDPFEPENIETVCHTLRRIKTELPDKTIWVYTGYKYEDFKDHHIMNYIDILVDGRFVEELKDISLHFRGSSNQRIISIPDSIEFGETIFVDYDVR